MPKPDRPMTDEEKAGEKVRDAQRGIDFTCHRALGPRDTPGQRIRCCTDPKREVEIRVLWQYQL
jgi:hypothetical protein